MCLGFIYQWQNSWIKIQLNLGKGAASTTPTLSHLLSQSHHSSHRPQVFLQPPFSLLLCLFPCLMAPLHWLSPFKAACWLQQTLGPVARDSWRAHPLRRSCPFTATWWVPLLGLQLTVSFGSEFWLENCGSINSATAVGYPLAELPNCSRTCFIHLRGLICVWLPHCVGGMEER